MAGALFRNRIERSLRESKAKIAGYGRSSQVTHSRRVGISLGVVVAENFRRRGVAEALTRRGLEIFRDIARMKPFTSRTPSIVRRSIYMRSSDFEEIQRPFEFPGLRVFRRRRGRFISLQH